VRLVPTPLSAALFAVGWLCGWFLLWRLPGTVRPRPDAPRRTIAVVVPARDEASSLPDLLATVLGQLRPGDDCVVVDDRSQDGTADVARAAGARVVEAPDLPAGWAGKPHACWVGAQATEGALVVFVDADVRLAPGTLDAVQAEQARRSGIVSVQPWHDARRPYEKLSLLFNIVALGGGAFSPLRDHYRQRIAYGPVLAIDRETYERTGGHANAAVRGAVAEDLALARVVGRSTSFAGRSLATFRMYPGGVRPLVEGWTKYVATGAASVPWWAGMATIAWLWSLVGGLLGSPLFVLASVAQVWVQGRRVGRFGLVSALCYPALVVFFLVVFVRSVALTFTGRR
jgi:4,4'-diaponeurosporenoate glycosyltransferase